MNKRMYNNKTNSDKASTPSPAPTLENPPSKNFHRRTPEEKAATVQKVLDFIAQGYTLTEIAKKPEMPRESLLCRWLTRNTHGVGETYARAREARADRIAREIFEITDNADERSPAAVNKARLQADVRRWYLSKILPEKYGDHIEISGRGGSPLTVAAIGAVGIAEIKQMRELIFGAIGSGSGENSGESDIIEAEEVPGNEG